MMPEKQMDKEYKLFINGEWTDGKDGKTFDSYSPANGELLSTCADASKEDVDEAVKSAWNAFEEWKETNAETRSNMLLKIADMLETEKEKFAMIETMDNGKPIRETMNVDLPLAIDHFRYFAGVIRAEEGEVAMIDKETMSIVLREPIGVVGQIIPWNFPFLMAAWKLAPAIAAGDTVVIKPSSLTSLSILEFAKILENVLPPGVVNIVTGPGSTTGTYLLQHPDLRKLAFTGSTDVGYIVADYAAKKLIPSTLELGGKSANIFFPDCPWDKAVEGAAIGILLNQGQVCCAGSRAFVHEDIYERFIDELVETFDKVKVGLPWEEDTMMGPLVSRDQINKVLGYIEVGKKEGANLIYGGYRITDDELENGFFVKPTIFTDVDNKMRIAQEEIFGPVLSVIRFKDDDEVIKMANDTEYGLAGAVWTKDINRALCVARAIEAGRIWVNNYNNLPAHAPFGGYKKSGIGRETHKMMLDHYTQKKNIYIHTGETRSGLY
ncbi:MAG TPA: aldehyde dehydrogenase [Halobacteria archaeon]|jgi:acyl-CoA reductase-like NAD-dependent aldehyde dehydrogenase|nr:aldehyde dehydrogenase [Halobacteria archaeon]